MKSLRKKRRVQVIALAGGALVLSTALIGYAMRDGINYFRSPSQVVESPPPPSGSLVRDSGETVHFDVTDGGATVPVRFTGVLPDLFGEGQGMVGTGRLEAGAFMASEILAKHDETYMPKEVIDALKEQGVYQASAANDS
jgi:cytochrome c-type biogenesis protein CcmE